MPEHFHLLISEPEKGKPSVVIQALKLGVVRRLFPTYRRETPRLFDDSRPRNFWQRRFYDFNVWSAHKRVEKLKYMHRNPVKRGLVESPDLWRWGSFRAYACGEPGVVRVNDWSVLNAKPRAA
jgi:putative transposase